MASDTKTLTAQCSCKAVHFTITVPTAKFPLPTHMCHCSICRYTHGTLNIFHAPLPSGVEPQFVEPSSLDKCTMYQHAKAQSKRYFCSTCGCHIGDDCLNGSWVIATAIFDANKGENNFYAGSHCFTKSLPGNGSGLHNFLPSIGDRSARFWDPDPAKEPEECEIIQPKAEVGADGEERLRAQCHCGGISFTFPRPDKSTLENPRQKRFVSPVDARKWLAVLDVCDDCRLVTGVQVLGWTFVPRSLIEPPLGEDLLLGTSKTYRSSPNVLRSFCGTCGATVIYSCDERSHDGDAVIDVAVGILRAPEGVLADNWLSWKTRKISWVEDGRAYDAEFTDSLRKGLENWGVGKYGEEEDMEPRS